MKKGNLSVEQIEQFNWLKNWYFTVMEFWEDLYPMPRGKSWKELLPDLNYSKKWLNGLKISYNDTLEMVRDLPPEKYKELDAILKEKFGHGLLEADKKYVDKINKIVAKGKIKNEEQYYMLREYFERIWDMNEYKETAAKIENMLHENELTVENA